MTGAAAVRPSNVLSVFYGYPAELIARWCGVSPATARAWKRGTRKPSRQALRLFTLHRDQRVLGDRWKRWRISEGYIVDPAGNRTTVAQLESYGLILQYAAALAARDPETHREYLRLLKA